MLEKTLKYSVGQSNVFDIVICLTQFCSGPLVKNLKIGQNAFSACFTHIISKAARDRKICCHTAESTHHWEESNEKNPLKIGWKFKVQISHKMTIFSASAPFISKMVRNTKKNAWSDYSSIFHKESNRKYPIKNRTTNKKVWVWPFFTIILSLVVYQILSLHSIIKNNNHKDYSKVFPVRKDLIKKWIKHNISELLLEDIIITNWSDAKLAHITLRFCLYRFLH